MLRLLTRIKKRIAHLEQTNRLVLAICVLTISGIIFAGWLFLARCCAPLLPQVAL